MRIGEIQEQIKNLQHLLGTNIPGTNQTVDDIIPAPDNNQLDDYINVYLKTESLSTAIQTFNIKDFEILLLSGTKKKDILDIKVAILSYWYREYF